MNEITPNKFIEETMEEFDNLQLKEYGKWRIDRNVAKAFLRSSLLAQRTAILEQVVPEAKKFPEIESDDFDAGYEFCRQEVENKIKELLNN